MEQTVFYDFETMKTANTSEEAFSSESILKLFLVRIPSEIPRVVVD